MMSDKIDESNLYLQMPLYTADLATPKDTRLTYNPY